MRTSQAGTRGMCHTHENTTQTHLDETIKIFRERRRERGGSSGSQAEVKAVVKF